MDENNSNGSKTEKEQSSLEDAWGLAVQLSALDKVELIQRLMDDVKTELQGVVPTPRRSLLGVLAHLGPAPSAEDIDEMRKEAFANFPREHFFDD